MMIKVVFSHQTYGPYGDVVDFFDDYYNLYIGYMVRIYWGHKGPMVPSF